MADNSYTFSFKLDGVEQSISNVQSLNKEVVSLQTNFVNTTNSAGANLQTTTKYADDLGTSVEKVGGKKFGENLEHSAKGAGKAIGALSNGMELFGAQSESVDKVSKALRILGEVTKVQELLGKSAAEAGKGGFLSQLKSIGALITGKQASAVASTEVAVAEGAQAVATTGAATAQWELNAAMDANPIGAILIAVGLLIAAYEIFTSDTVKLSEVTKAQLDILNDLDDAATKISKNSYFNAKLQNDSAIGLEEKKLELLKAQGGGIEAQAIHQAELIKLKQKGLEVEIANQKAIELNANLLREEMYPAYKKLVEENKKLTPNTDKFKENLEVINAYKEKAKQKEDEITEAQNKQKELGVQLTNSNEYDLKILKAQTQEEREQLKLKQEQALLDARNKVVAAKGDTKSKKFEGEKLNIQDDIEKIKQTAEELSDAIGESFIQKRIELLVEAERKAINLSLQEYINAETEKSNVKSDALNKEADAIDQSIKTENFSEATKVELTKKSAQLRIESANYIAESEKQINEQKLRAEKDFQKKKQNIIDSAPAERQTNINNIVDNAGKGAEKAIQDLIDKNHDLTEKMKSEGGIRIGLFGRESKELKKNYEKATDDIITDLENKKQNILNALVGSDPALIKQVEDAFDKMINGIKKKVKSGGKEISKSFKEVFKETIDDIKQATDAVFSVLDSIQAFEDTKAEIRKQALQNEIDDLQNQADEKARIANESNSRINDLESQLKGARGNRHKYLLELIATEFKRKKDAQKEEQALLAKKAEDEAKIKEIQKQQTIKSLKLDKAKTITQGILAEAEIIASLAGLPFGIGLVAGIAAAAALAVGTAIQVANIDAQLAALKFGGDLLPGGGATPAKEYKITRGGGEVAGASHDDGGVRGTGKFNNVEVEGGEFIVNKLSTNANRDVLKTINSNPGAKFTLAPVAQNVSHRYAMGGALPNFNTTERAATSIKTISPQEIMDAVIAGMQASNIEVSVVEINKTNAKVAKIKELSTV